VADIKETPEFSPIEESKMVEVDDLSSDQKQSNEKKEE